MLVLDHKTKITKPVFYAIILHMILLGLLLFSWQIAEKPQAKPITSIKATIYQTPTVTKSIKNDTIAKAKTEPKTAPIPPVKPIPAITKNKVDPPKPQPKKEPKKEPTKVISKKEEKPVPIKKEDPVKQLTQEPIKANNNSNIPLNTVIPEPNPASAPQDKNNDLLAQLLADSKNYSAQNPHQESANQQQINNATTAKFDALIGQLVSQQWIIPASARRGMQVEINIELQANGIIASAVVVSSSGNFSLDNSAIAAIKAVAVIYEVQDMTPAEFQLIRNRTLVFSPAL